MESTSLMNKWKQVNEKHNKKWSIVILSLLSMAFAVTDWMFGIFTFAEFFLMFIGVCLVVSGNYQIQRKQIKWIALVASVIIVNIVLNELNNELFVLKIAVAGLIKISFYVMINIGLYNYVMKYTLEKKLLKIINLVAIVVCIIGIYITVALYSEGALPYDFFWKYTRTDFLSYNYNGLFRTRSLFSEPSYLGYYLNIIIGMNLFNSQTIKISSWITLLLTITVILTFSYSSIAVLLLIYILYFFNLTNLKKFQWNKKTLVYAVILLITLFLFKDVAYETLIQRSIDIINGKDFSAIFRVVRSWDYVNKEHIFMGNGIGHTPAIWNVYAYVLSDLGLIAFVLFVLFSIGLLIKNYKLGIIFIVLNFQKGGYLSSAFWIYLLILFVYVAINNHKDETYN